MNERANITVLCSVVALAVLGAGSLQAADYNWNVGDGAFDTPSSWDPAGPPAGGDTALFALPGSHTVTFGSSPANGLLSISYGDYDFNLQGNTYTLNTGVSVTVGDEAGSEASLTLLDGTLSGRNAGIGYQAGSDGTVTVDGAGSFWTNSFNFYVGKYGSGALNILNGGAVSSSSTSYQRGSHIGAYNGSNGTVTVDGAGSIWTDSGNMYIGGLYNAAGGTGELTVSNGGSVSVTGTLKLWSGGTLNISNGNISSASMVNVGGTVNISDGNISTASMTNNGGAVNFDNGTLTTESFQSAADSLSGVGVINTHGLASDVDLVFDAENGLTQILTIDGPGQDITVNLDADGSGAMGAGYGGEGSMHISDGVALQSTHGYIGYAVGSNGTVTADGSGSTWTNSKILYVGSSGTGVLNVLNGGAVSNASGYVGRYVGSDGTVTVDGSGSTWTNSGALYIAGSNSSGGTGELTVSNGGSVNVTGTLKLWSGGTLNISDGNVSAASVINNGGAVNFDNGTLTTELLQSAADNLSGVGVINTNSLVSDVNLVFDAANGLTQVLTIDGPGQDITVNLDADGSGPMGAGYGGEGSMHISDALTLQSTDGYVGYEAGSNGTVTVDGAGSTWTNSSFLQVGFYGTGALNVLNGGAVSNTYAYVGRYVGSDGTVTVDGAGSTWTNSSFFQVGANGTGVLNVLNGGAVSNKSGSVGTSVGSDGRVTVDGAGSTWTNLQSFKVGANGAGVLNVLNGGAVSNTAGYVGYAVGSNGTVTVDGAGSTWTNSSFLMVGSNGTGALNVLNGGAVSNTFGYVGRYVGSDGTVIVDGAGSTWTNSGSLLVGVNGTGTLNVLNGGAVSSAYGYVGLHAGSGGTVTVAGAGSTWANSDGLYIGGWSNSTGGAGQVTVDNGGLVSVGMQLEVWREGTLDTTSSGEVVVGGAAVGAAGSLTIGSDAAGEFSVVDGGGVSNSTGYIGYSSGSVGAATVDGAGSTWANSNSLYIGGSSSSAGGTGELTISNDGSVHATNTLKLWSGGTLNVSGGNISAALMINDGGTVNFTSGRLNCTGEFSLGTDEFLGSSVTLGPAMTLSVGDTLELMSGSTLNVSGGTVSAAAMVNSGGTANFTSGWVNCTGDFSVAPGEFLGSNPTLGSGTTLSVAGTLTIDSLSDLTLNGGRLSAGSLQAYGEFTFNSGTFVLTDGDLTIGAGGQLGSTVELSSGQAVEVTNTTTVNAEGMITLDRGSLLSGELANDGLVRLESLASVLSGGVVTNRGEISGTGRISAMLVNEIAGEVRAGTGEQLRFSGLGNSNAGSIEAIGGEVEFTGDLTNAASTGLITGRNAMLRFAGGLTNAGSVALSFGTSDIFGDIDNEESGRIVISGAGNATFYDDLVNDGSVRISAGSSAVYFGEVSGSGSFIGTGTNYFEGDLCPGSSPGELDFGGDVVFGPFSSLQIELGGMLIGDEHDCLNVAGVLTLSGTLDVALIGDFTPAGGDTFDILNWGALAGATFDEVNLPELSDGLDWDTSELYTIGELSVTPEPATAAALLLGLGAVIRRRRKRLA